MAGGTGDIALRVLKDAGVGTRAVICDMSAEMIETGRARGEGEGESGRLAFVRGNAEGWPFADKSFDAYTIAFGVRNVTQIDEALGEAYRVLKPGGRFFCLEFSKSRRRRSTGSTTSTPRCDADPGRPGHG